jgi:hypothetical protein
MSSLLHHLSDRRRNNSLNDISFKRMDNQEEFFLNKIHLRLNIVLNQSPVT